MGLKHFISCIHGGNLWLGHRQRIGAQPEFKCFEPLGGYGHRASKPQRSGERFGGAWLPGCDVPSTKQATEAYLVTIAIDSNVSTNG